MGEWIAGRLEVFRAPAEAGARKTRIDRLFLAYFFLPPLAADPDLHIDPGMLRLD